MKERYFTKSITPNNNFTSPHAVGLPSLLGVLIALHECEDFDYMKTQKSIALKMIDAAYFKLERCCEHTREWDRYVEMNRDEEKEHRRFKPDFVQCGLTIAQSVKYFTVKEVFERIVPAHENEAIWMPEAKDIFSIRQSIFGACAIVDICGTKIREAFTLGEMSDWLKWVDYTELNKDPRKEQVTA